MFILWKRGYHTRKINRASIGSPIKKKKTGSTKVLLNQSNHMDSKNGCYSILDEKKVSVICMLKMPFVIIRVIKIL